MVISFDVQITVCCVQGKNREVLSLIYLIYPEWDVFKLIVAWPNRTCDVLMLDCMTV